jgi:hypothetical protein
MNTDPTDQKSRMTIQAACTSVLLLFISCGIFAFPMADDPISGWPDFKADYGVL